MLFRSEFKNCIKFIGVELDNNYFNIASKRIEEAYFYAQNEGALNE